MKKKSISIVMVLSVFLLPILVNLLMSIPNSWLKGDVSDWITFYGSYFGALLGGIVAFGVASIQISASRNQARSELFIQQLPTLVQLQYEIEKIKNCIEKLKSLENLKLPNDGDVRISHFNDSFFPINENIWHSIDRILDVKLIENLIKFREDFFNLREALTTDIREIEIKCQKKNLELTKIANKKDSFNINKRDELLIELKNLRILLETAKDNKIYHWDRIKGNLYIIMIKEIEDKVINLIDEINKINKMYSH